MERLLEHYGITPSRGGKYVCCFHNDTNPSASIHKKTDAFHCFTCGKHLDVINFVQEKENVSFESAIKMLDTWFGLGLDENLDYAKKKKFIKMLQENKKEQERKKEYQEFKRKIIAELGRKIQIFDALAIETEKKFAEFVELHLSSIKELERLNWLFNKIVGLDQDINIEFELIYGETAEELLEKIKKGEIKI